MGILSKQSKASISNIGIQVDNKLELDKSRVANKLNGFFTTIASTLVNRLPIGSGKYSDCVSFYAKKGVKQNAFKLDLVSEENTAKVL